MVFWKIDRLVDQKDVDDDTVELIDPITVQIFCQHTLTSQSLVHLYDKGIPEIIDLLCTDIKVDGPRW